MLDGLFGSLSAPKLKKAPSLWDFDPKMGIDFGEMARQQAIREKSRVRRVDLRIEPKEALRL